MRRVDQNTFFQRNFYQMFTKMYGCWRYGPIRHWAVVGSVERISDTTTGLLLQRLHGIPTPMPPDAPLVQLQPGNYDLIALWIQEGALNN